MAIYSVSQSGEDIARDAEAFFAEIADEDLLSFLQQLPMAWGNDEPMTLTDFVYEALLWPFVKSAWQDVEGAPGIAGRMGQLVQVFAKAEQDLERETGRVRRVRRVTNLASFMDAYTDSVVPA
ncbi:hypothetical protein [Cognatishimia sp. MH4019]|uniref:hypothetical protein n=1 Tax=Cognatishimia sp. MH4019 TaxID=2854030 RepID=UPI001CD26098|nr:hypothetical protein [Cognatishimia sp. MH4019]